MTVVSLKLLLPRTSSESIPSLRSCIRGPYQHYRKFLVPNPIHRAGELGQPVVLTFHVIPCNPDVQRSRVIDVHRFPYAVIRIVVHS